MTTATALETFDIIRKSNTFHTYLCDDIYNIILFFLEKKYCHICYKWIGENKINACFMENTTLCFICRHRYKWPK